MARQNQELLELSNAEHRQRELAEGLVQSTIAVTYSLQLEDVLNAILEQIHRTIPFKLANIALLEGKSVRVVDQLAFDAHRETEDILENNYELDMFPLWLVTYSSQQPVFITDTREFSTLADRPRFGMDQILCLRPPDCQWSGDWLY